MPINRNLPDFSLRQLFFIKCNGKATTNLKLWWLAEEELKGQKLETAGLEIAMQLFGKQKKQDIIDHAL